jgi:hypothetical protein
MTAGGNQVIVPRTAGAKTNLMLAIKQRAADYVPQESNPVVGEQRTLY